MKRFNAATMIIQDVLEEFAIQAFMSGTNHQFLKYNLVDKPPARLFVLHETVHRLVESTEV